MKTIIPVNKQQSAPIDVSLNTLQMIYTPYTMTSTTFTFLVSEARDGSSDYHRLGDGSGNAYTVTFVAGDAVPLDPGIFASAVSIIIVAGTTELTTDKTLSLTFIPR